MENGIQTLRCCVCDQSFQGRQFYNQDTGFGMGPCCATIVRYHRPFGHEPMSLAEFERTYGVQGINYDIPTAQPETTVCTIDTGDTEPCESCPKQDCELHPSPAAPTEDCPDCGGAKDVDKPCPFCFDVEPITTGAKKHHALQHPQPQGAAPAIPTNTEDATQQAIVHIQRAITLLQHDPQAIYDLAAMIPGVVIRATERGETIDPLLGA